MVGVREVDDDEAALGGGVQHMQVYINYDRSDGEVASDLAAKLSEAGIDVWLDQEKLYPGDNWHLAIGEALERSEAMIVLVSTASMQSEFVRNGIQFALGSPNYENRVIPVMVRDTVVVPWMLLKFGLLSVDEGVAEVTRQIVERLRSPSRVAD